MTRAKVCDIIQERPGVQEVEVFLLSSGCREKAVYYTSDTSRLQQGDEVIINTTAIDLALGTGGYHFVVAKINDAQASEDLYPSRWGHVMKLRYTPWQLSVDTVEEQGSPYHALFCDESLSLELTPVIIAELHSLLPMLCLAIHAFSREKRIVYVMPDGSSLPMTISRHVHHLKQAGLLSATVSSGQAWGGDFEAVNLHTGLLTAKHLGKADIIICLLGPGVVGTGTPLGFSGVQLADIIHAASLLDGVPIVVPRVSFADPRPRHLGISHHTRTVLQRFVLTPTLIPLPQYEAQLQAILENQMCTAGWMERHYVITRKAQSLEKLLDLQRQYPESIASMGRSVTDDPAPFQAAYLAAELGVFASDPQKNSLISSPHARNAPAILAESWACLQTGEA